MLPRKNLLLCSECVGCYGRCTDNDNNKRIYEKGRDFCFGSKINNEGIREFVSLKQTLQSAWACFFKKELAL